MGVRSGPHGGPDGSPARDGGQPDGPADGGARRDAVPRVHSLSRRRSMPLVRSRHGDEVGLPPPFPAGPGRPAPYETALCQAIVEAVAPLAHGREITGVRVRVGGHPADPDLVRRCMREATAGTVAERAAVEFIMDPPVVRCRDCGDETATAYALALLACRRCGSFEIDVTGCGDLTLESITFAS